MNEFSREVIEAGSFLASVMRGNAGDTYTFYTTTTIPRAQASWRQIVVTGGLRVVEKPVDAPEWPVQGPGAQSQELPDIIPGSYVYEATMDGTMFVSLCNQLGRGRILPFSHAYLDKASGSFNLPQGGVLLLGSGNVSVEGGLIEGPMPIYARTKPLTIAVLSVALGVAMWR